MHCVTVTRLAGLVATLFAFSYLMAAPAEARTCKHSWPNEKCKTVKKAAKKGHVTRHAKAKHRREASWIREAARHSCKCSGRRYDTRGYGYTGGYYDAGGLARQLEREGRFGHHT